jgi:uracil-DNA glycosylase
MLDKYFDKTWISAIGEDNILGHLSAINQFLSVEREEHTVLPPVGSDLLFKAFRVTPFDKVRVVILGQDPYHDTSYNGLAFGNGAPTSGDKAKSPSLRNILKEVTSSGAGVDGDASLYSWAAQGVLLINTAHTVIQGQAGSHLHVWDGFTKAVIAALTQRDNIVWLLWGSKAHAYESLVTKASHLVIKSGHPSPLNRTKPFVGCNCFNECNFYLSSKKIKAIKW